MGPGPKSRYRWVWGFSAAVILLPALGILIAHRSATAVVERHHRDIGRLFDRFRARAAARPCVFGEPQPGSAEPFYRQAIAQLSAMTDQEQEAIPEMEAMSREPDDGVIAVVLLKYRPVLGLVREALRRSPSGAWVDRRDRTGDELRPIRSFLLSLIGHHQRCGRTAEAFEAYFLLLGVAQDEAWETGTLSVVRAVEEQDSRRMFEALAEHTLTVPEADRVLETLAKLESARPTLQDELDVEEARLRALVADPKKDEVMSGPYRYGYYRPIQPSWKNLWSRAIARAASLNEVEIYFERRREIASLPWHRIQVPFVAYMESEVGHFVRPPEGHGLQLEHAELYEIYAETDRVRLRAAIGVAREELIHDRFPSQVPGSPLSPHSGLPLVVKDECLVDPTAVFGATVEIGRRR